MQSYQRRKKRLILFKMMCVVLVVLIAIISLDTYIRPGVQQMAAYEAHNFATRAINQAIAEELAQEEVRYEKLAHISTNSSGAVTAVEMDIVGLNRLKTNLMDRVMDALEGLQDSDLQVPMGTLFGGQYLAGRGPLVNFRIVPIGYAESSVENAFTAAGINQTCHQIMLHVSVSITALMPGYRVPTQVSTEICLAETIIVGVVPESFTKVTGDNRDDLSKLNDYLSVK